MVVANSSPSLMQYVKLIIIKKLYCHTLSTNQTKGVTIASGEGTRLG